MLIKITFNDLVSCNPANSDPTSDMVVHTQGEVITIPFSSFQYVNKDDGRSITIKVQTYSFLGGNWIFYVIVHSRAVPLVIEDKLVLKINKVI